MLRSMMTAQVLLAVGLVVSCVVVAAWDIYCLAVNAPGSTVSNLFGHWGEQFPVFPFLLGLLAGHLFWPRGGPSVPIPGSK